MATKIAKVPSAVSVQNTARSLFHILLAARTAAVLFSNIWDCDESYNYFEPAHFLMYGFGCQTWEYAPNYSLRSYAYLLFHIAAVYVPAVVFFASKIFVFYMIRFFLVMLEVWSQRNFTKAVTNQFGSAVGDMTLLLVAFSPGYFQASTAFLPSSSAMVIFQYAMAAFINKQYYRTAFAGALSAFLVWPFSAALYIPAALAVIFDLKLKSFVFAFKLAILVIVGVIAPIVAIDSIFYGKFTAAAVNIFIYNFLSTDASRGSHLFGTAPTSFYFMNLFLNFNLAVPFAFIGLLVLAFVSRKFYSNAEGGERKSVAFVFIATLILWLGIFWPQPHKEERFLYPIYPLFCVAAAIGLQFATTVIYRILFSWEKLRAFLADCIQFGFIAIFVLLSLSRCAALYFNYHASMDVYLRFSDSVKLPATSSDARFNFCLGREWHRAPGHFLLADNRIRLRFIESAFDGLVPAHYFENMTIANATRTPRYDMNDLNREEVSHYIPVTECHFLADINMESFKKKRWEKEPNYAADKSGTWAMLIRLPYLAYIDREEIEMPAWKSLAYRLLRAFYVPYFSPMFTSSYFRDYVVLQNTHLMPLKITPTV